MFMEFTIKMYLLYKQIWYETYFQKKTVLLLQIGEGYLDNILLDSQYKVYTIYTESLLGSNWF